MAPSLSQTQNIIADYQRRCVTRVEELARDSGLKSGEVWNLVQHKAASIPGSFEDAVWMVREELLGERRQMIDRSVAIYEGVAALLSKPKTATAKPPAKHPWKPKGRNQRIKRR